MRLSNSWLKDLIAPHEAPCVSIYMPMLRADPPAAENARLYRDLVEKARIELESGYPAKGVSPLIERLQAVPPDERFWVGPRDGVAVFASTDGYVRVVDLHRRPDAMVQVADSFHVKPMIRLMQSESRYHVLTVTMKQVQVFEADQFGIKRLEPRIVPQDPDIVSKMRMSNQVNMATDMATATSQYPGEGTAPAGVSGERFMRAVDKGVWEEFSRDSKLPLVLVADENTNALFRSVSNNTHLLGKGVTLDPQSLDFQRLHQETWKLMEPQFQEEVRKLTDQFMAAQARQKGSAELQPVAAAAAVGRVDTLFVDATRHIPGRLEPTDDASVQFRPAEMSDPRADDVLDDLAEMVLKTDGAVLVLPPEMMPSETGVAAIYRY